MASIELFPEDEAEKCIRVQLTPHGADRDDTLIQAIPVRQSNRRRYDGRPIPDTVVSRLLDANDRDTVAVEAFRVGETSDEPIIEFVKEGARAQFSDPAFVEELVIWIRFSRREVRERQDGLMATSLGIAHAHVNMPCEVVAVREKLATHLGLSDDEQPLLLIWFGYAEATPRAPRRPVTEVCV